MIEGEVLRAPVRSRSKVALITPLLREGLSRAEIGARLDMSGYPLTDLMRRPYRLGYLERPSLERRREALREHTSEGRGAIWISVRRYFPFDMTSRQTRVALRFLEGKELETGQISHAYARERYRHGMERPFKALQVESQGDKHRSDEDLLFRAFRKMLSVYPIPEEFSGEKGLVELAMKIFGGDQGQVVPNIFARKVKEEIEVMVKAFNRALAESSSVG